MLLEPYQSGKAKRIVRHITEHKPMPCTSLIKPAHILAKCSQTVIQIRVWLNS